MQYRFNNILIIISFMIVISVIGYGIPNRQSRNGTETLLDPIPRDATLSGTFVCLPLIDTRAPQTEECIFGLKTDDGEYYMVNFGQSADSMKRFRAREHVIADGFIVIKEALSTDQWVKYNMKGIFTVTKFN